MVPTMIVMSIMNEANELFLEKKFEKAIEKYNRVLHDEPNNLIALNNKGYSFSKLRNYSKALVCYDECLEKNPEDKNCIDKQNLII